MNNSGALHTGQVEQRHEKQHLLSRSAELWGSRKNEVQPVMSCHVLVFKHAKTRNLAATRLNFIKDGGTNDGVDPSRMRNQLTKNPSTAAIFPRILPDQQNSFLVAGASKSDGINNYILCRRFCNGWSMAPKFIR